MIGVAFRLMPRIGASSIALVGAYALASLLYPLLSPQAGSGVMSGIARLIVGGLIELAIVYRLVGDMLERPSRLAGLAWFYAGSSLMLLPLCLVIGALSLFSLQDGEILAALFVAFVVGFACLMLFQAWPVAMAEAGRWIRPMRILRATRGHRHHLLFALLIVGVLSGIPGPEAGQPAVRATMLSFAQFAGIGFQTIFLAGLAAAAWRGACANDPGLHTPPGMD